MTPPVLDLFALSDHHRAVRDPDHVLALHAALVQILSVENQAVQILHRQLRGLVEFLVFQA